MRKIHWRDEIYLKISQIRVVPSDELIKSVNIKLRTLKNEVVRSTFPLFIFKLVENVTFLRSLTLPGLIWKEFAPQRTFRSRIKRARIFLSTNIGRKPPECLIFRQGLIGVF
jgi:hypothetical protein